MGDKKAYSLVLADQAVTLKDLVKHGTYRHRKTGGEYVVKDVAHLQIGAIGDDVHEEYDMSLLVIYQSLAGPVTFARPLVEFKERFEPINA